MAFINIWAVALSLGHCKSPYRGFDVRSPVLLSYTGDCICIGWRSLAILYAVKGKNPSSRKRGKLTAFECGVGNQNLVIAPIFLPGGAE